MGELQQLFTHLVNNIQSFLSQAQAASLVEKYVLEVNLSANEPTSILSNPNQHALLCSALTALLHTLLKVVEYCRSIRKKTYQHSRTEISESQTMDDLSVSQVSSTEKQQQQQQQHQHNIIARNNQGVNNIQTEEEQRKSDKLSPRVSHNPSEVTSVGHHTPPQHPTTKEAEAANVLMNLSGKASTSDRLGQAGLDSGVTCLSPPAHILQLSSRDLSSSKDHNRFVEYSCPESLLVTNNSISSNNVYSSTSLTYLTSDITTLKPAVYCWADEVPQINEEDLLPLATEVVCNVCEQQCKDVVELHEHLLAAHNTPDNPHDTLHQSKKLKNHSDENSEYVDTSRVILQESGGSKVLTKERKYKRKSRSKRIDDMNCNVSDKVSIFSSENCVRSSEVLDRNQNHTLTTSLQTVDDPSAKEPSTYILPSSTPSTCLVTTKSVVDNGYVFSTPQKGTTNTGETHICMSPYSSQNNPPVIESSVEGHQQAFSPAARVTPSTDSLHTFILPHSSSGNPTVVVKSDSFGAKNQDLLRYHSHNTATEVVTAANDLLPTTGEKLAAGTDALAIAIEKSQIETKEVKVMIFVCVDCSCGFTENEEASKHTCLPGQPLIKRHPDCSVTLSDNHPMSQIPQERIDQELYFPEFVIRQIKGQTGVKDQFIVHTETSCTLQLYTPYQPDYMRHQLVSFRCLLCKSECDNMGVFLRHLQHGPCIFRCPDCPISYNTHTKLFTHRSNLHPNLEERTCPNCHQVFEKRHQRNKHLKTKCSQRLTCSVCSRTLKNEYILSVHMLSHKERSHECSECGATFHRRTVLQQHQMRHTGTKPHACPRCDSRFYTRQHLHIHLDRHDRHKRFPCDACSRAYYSKHDLEAHRSKVHPRLSRPEHTDTSSQPTKHSQSKIQRTQRTHTKQHTRSKAQYTHTDTPPTYTNTQYTHTDTLSTQHTHTNTQTTQYIHTQPTQHTQPTHTNTQPTHTNTQPTHTNTQPTHTNTQPTHTNTQLTQFAHTNTQPTQPTHTNTQPTQSTHTNTQPSHTNTQPTLTNTQPTHTNTQPSHTNTQPTHTNTQPTHTNTQPTYTNTQPTYTNTQPTYTNTQNTHTNTQPTQHTHTNTQPTHTNTQPTHTNTQPTHTNTQPTYTNTQPTYTNTQPTYTNTQLTQYTHTDTLPTQHTHTNTQHIHTNTHQHTQDIHTSNQPITTTTQNTFAVAVQKLPIVDSQEKIYIHHQHQDDNNIYTQGTIALYKLPVLYPQKIPKTDCSKDTSLVHYSSHPSHINITSDSHQEATPTYTQKIPKTDCSKDTTGLVHYRSHPSHINITSDSSELTPMPSRQEACVTRNQSTLVGQSGETQITYKITDTDLVHYSSHPSDINITSDNQEATPTPSRNQSTSVGQSGDTQIYYKITE